MSNEKFLVLISVDALNKKDYDYIQKLPNFRSFFEEGAHCKEVTSVYPTVTYTCHTSLSTGHYPDAHGIYNNEIPNPQTPLTQDWHWFEKDIKVPTLFDYATRNNLKTATFLWPVMADAPVTYNLPEIWSPDDSISGLKLLWRYGTKNMLWPAIRYIHLKKGKSQPHLDNFTEQVALHTIKKNKPHLSAIHFTDLDTMRHLHGLHSEEANDALKRIDERIGNILDLYETLGIKNQTNFVLLGDHGTHDFNKVIELNTLFEKEGLLSVNHNYTINHWDAYASSSGGSTQIHLADPKDSHLKDRVYKILNTYLEQEDSPIKAIYSDKDALEMFNLKGDFSFIVEAKDNCVFRNSLSGDVLYDSHRNPKTYLGDHGFLPTHEDQKTLLLMKGPSIKKGAVINQCSLIDEAPTFAKLLDITMEKVSGKILFDLLN